ncbi:MAG: hypothetical protein U1D30_07620 [Planctomycetota bacterium]
MICRNFAATKWSNDLLVGELETIHDDNLVPAVEADSCRWQSTKQRLEEVERLEKRRLPLKLKEVMGPDGSLDRARLSVASKELIGLAGRLHQSIETFKRWLPPSEWERLFDAQPANLIEYFETLRSDAARELDRLAFLGELLGATRTSRQRAWASAVDHISQWLDARKTAGVGRVGWRFLHHRIRHGNRLVIPRRCGQEGALLPPRREGVPLDERTVRGLTDGGFRSDLTTGLGLADPLLARGFDDSWSYVVTELFDGSTIVSNGITLSTAPIPEIGEWSKARLNDLD